MNRKPIVVTFAVCGAETHAAFSSATKQDNGRFALAYPIHCKWLQKSKAAQTRWANDKVAHLKTWIKSDARIEE